MRPRPIFFLSLLLAGLALQAQSKKPREPAALPGYDPGGGVGKTLYEVPIEGTIDLGLAPFVERVLAEATAGGGSDSVVVLRIKTFGGRVDGAVRIRDALLASKAPTVAYVDRRAISAGALIGLACDTLIMSRGGSIGAATPVQGGGTDEVKATSEKVVSYMRAEMRATAEAKGRDGDIAEAMVDEDKEIKGVTEKGKLLTLTSDMALELGIADALAEDYAGAIALLNLKGATRVDARTDWGEKLARLLTDPVVSSLLMTFGFLGLLMELYTPGFGVGGVIGLVCLGLFFFGQYAANLAGWEDLLLFVAGLGLLLVELLVIPGFGVAGVAGLALMGAALVMAMVELRLPWDVSFELGYVQEALSAAAWRILIALGAMIAGAIVFGKYFARSPLGRWLVLSSSAGAAEGYVSGAPGLSDLLGKRGRALSALRPSGIAEIDGRRVDVVTEGGFIDGQSALQVVQVDGHRVVVRQAAESDG